MIYVKDVERGLRFYRDLPGFKLIEDFRYDGTPVYARLRAPGGDATIALHQAGPGVSVSSDGVPGGDAYGFRGTNDSRGGIEKDVVKECSGGWVPS